jgi:hypothetical protein
LQTTQGDGRGGVAGQDHQAGAGLEQALAAGPRQVHNLLPWPAAIGGVGLIGQIDEVRLGQTLHEGAVDREAAHAGVEDADGHVPALARRRLGVHARGRVSDGETVQAAIGDVRMRASPISAIFRYIENALDPGQLRYIYNSDITKRI